MRGVLSRFRASLLLPAQLRRLEHVESEREGGRERAFSLDQVSSSCFIVITSSFEVYDSVQRITLSVLPSSFPHQPPLPFDQLPPLASRCTSRRK